MSLLSTPWSGPEGLVGLSSTATSWSTCFVTSLKTAPSESRLCIHTFVLCFLPLLSVWSVAISRWWHVTSKIRCKTLQLLLCSHSLCWTTCFREIHDVLWVALWRSPLGKELKCSSIVTWVNLEMDFEPIRGRSPGWLCWNLMRGSEPEPPSKSLAWIPDPYKLCWANTRLLI